MSDETIGTIEERGITEEMQESYLSYAMSVIVSRALPDVRDGLKPVQRRILYAMRQLGLGGGTKHQKSAKVVGAVLGAYHPHGDSAAYEAMVRMAQDFSLRYPLVDGQGNFGSLDGDSAAAMRYTEVRMSKMGDAMLRDIDKDTVDFVPNYDGTQNEPTVLPSVLPQLLLNGTLGIAVGMATSIPPHNLGEVADALSHLIDKPNASAEDLTQFIKGPDFPTGGIIYNTAEIKQAYATGRGPIVMRGKAEIVEGVTKKRKKKKGYQIIVNEIPYMVNKATLLEKVADLVKGGKIEGVSDIRDESDRDGLRIAIDLKDGAFPKKVLNRLYKFTDLQKTFHVNMVALVDGVQPQLLSLRSVLQEYIRHRRTVIIRRFRYELKRAKERVHILEGLAVALNHIDAVIKTIKKSKSKEDAHQSLRKKYKLSDLQATAILEMRLQTLAGLERKKITDELSEKKKFIAEIEAILKSEKKILKVVKKELLEVRKAFADERRTEVMKGAVGEISEEDLVPEEETIITVTHEGYIKRVDPKTYRRQRRGGKGIIGVKTRQDDFVEHFFTASTHDDLLFFTASGKVYAVKAYEVPEGSRTARGKAIVNFLELPQDETIAAVRSLSKNSESEYLVLVTEQGMIKKTSLEQFQNIRRSGLIAINLKKGDCLRWVQETVAGDSILLVTEQGMSIHFSEGDLRPMGRATQGVRGIALKNNDGVIGMTVVHHNDEDKESDKKQAKGKEKTQYFLMVTRNGYGKRTDFKEYRLQRRGGSGIKAMRVIPKTGNVISARLLRDEWSDLILSSVKGQVIRMPLKNIGILSRVTQGVRLIRLDDDDEVAALAAV